ncbi:MAG: metal-dependent transcriptional regulator [Clostridia bacterium]|nr:metal-dependent transcriptional regulator [Clostridia bacterium]
MHESGEMYLETIFVLNEKSDNVRSIDVCDYMGYSKPSVSRAVGLLKKAGHIVVDGNGYITLTESGKAIAHRMYERHTILTAALGALGVSEQTASKDACKIEHDISDETFDAIKRWYNRNFK